jgi:hypothetical protein
MAKVIYCGDFRAKDRAGSAYENEFDAAPRRTPAQVEAEIKRRKARRDMFVANNELKRGKM